jgi:hypothetical protein
MQRLQADIIWCSPFQLALSREKCLLGLRSSPSHIPLELFDNDAASARYLLSRSKTVTMQIKLSLPFYIVLPALLLARLGDCSTW